MKDQKSKVNNMKSNDNESKEKVVLFAIYDEGDLDYSIKKEESLKKYCEAKNYEIVKIFRTGIAYLAWNFSEVVEQFLKMVYKYRVYDKFSIPEHKDRNYTKLICYDIKEMCSKEEQIAMLGVLANENLVELETIKQGNIGKNFVYSIDTKEDVQKEVKESSKFVVVEDTPF